MRSCGTSPTARKAKEGDAVVPNHEIGFGSGLCGGVRHIVCRCAFRGFRGGSVVDFGLGQLF